MIKAIFFDFGGVLTETCWDLDVISSLIRKAFTEMRIELPNTFDEEFIKVMKDRWRAVLRTQMEERLIDILRELLSRLRVNYDEGVLDLAIEYVMDAPFCVVRKEAKYVLERLKEMGFKLGIISNSPIAFHKRVLQKHNLLQYFDDIVISCEVGYRKPDTRIFLIALERLNVRPPESVYVGDIPCIDIPGAKKLGMITALMKYADPAVSMEDINSNVSLEKDLNCEADYLIESLDDLLKIIKEINLQ